MGIFTNTKDRVVEKLALAYLNNALLQPYGRATELRIDSTAKKIHITAELRGETAPLEVEITDYEIRRDGEIFLAQIKALRTSREWLTTLAVNHLQNVPLKLPAQFGGLLIHAL